ncbi:MAG: hypothetical protein V2A74_09695 [bacterium]
MNFLSDRGAEALRGHVEKRLRVRKNKGGANKMPAYTTREEATAARAAVGQEIKEFEQANSAIFARWREMQETERQSTWPPPGHEECSGYDADGRECCSATFPKGEIPEGWVESRYSCGDGGSGTFYCPAHAEQGKESSGRCDYCSR